mgnify:CR=1 FL=1
MAVMSIGDKVIWKDPYWSDLTITGEIIEDLGNKVVILDEDAETNDDRLEFKKSELEMA